MNYTPGPWKVTHYNGHTQIQYDGPDHEWIVAEVYGQEDDSIPRMTRHGYASANAQLISVAPKMLKTLRRFIAWECDPDRYAGDLADMVQEASAVVARAEGEP